MNIFEKAARLKIRFETEKGILSTETLWSSEYEFLTRLEESLTQTVESYGKSTRRQKQTKSNVQELNELRLEIVKYILDEKEKASDQAAAMAEVRLHNQKVLELIKAKKEAELANLSIAELEALLK